MGRGPQQSMGSKRPVILRKKNTRRHHFYKHETESIFLARFGRYPKDEQELIEFEKTYYQK